MTLNAQGFLQSRLAIEGRFGQPALPGAIYNIVADKADAPGVYVFGVTDANDKPVFHSGRFACR